MEFILLDFFILHPFLGYALAFFGMFVEGDLVLFSAAFLAHLGVFDVVWLAAVSFFGMLAGDALWYGAGRFHQKLPRFLARLFERVASPFDRALNAHPFRTLLVGKFAYGIHRLILARGGGQIPFARFFKKDLVATAVWVAALMSAGYFGGFAINQLKGYYRFAEIGLLIGIIIVIFAEKAVKKFSLTLSEKNGNSGRTEREEEKDGPPDIRKDNHADERASPSRASCTTPFEATKKSLPPNSHGLPSKSVITPPASSTRSAPAA